LLHLEILIWIINKPLELELNSILLLVGATLTEGETNAVIALDISELLGFLKIGYELLIIRVSVNELLSLGSGLN